jgi:hypothetical protein
MISTTNLEFQTFEENKAKTEFARQEQRNSTSPDVVTPRFPFYVRDRLPVHILENHELYVKFIEAYFEWLGISNNIDQIPYLIDIKNVPNNLLIHHKELFAHLFPETSISDDTGDIIYNWNDPENSLVDIRRFLSFIRQFYLTKGTEESTRFLLSSLFGINAGSIDFDYPKVQLCILSDSVWVPNLVEDTDTLGNVYDGYWADSRKTLSGGVRLQDQYFQQFSYSITSISTSEERTTRKSEDYEFTTKPVKDITHPAGFKLFNNVGPDSYQPAPPGPIDTGYSERPLIGHYLAYRFDSTLNGREPFPNLCNVTDLFPCGFNPYTTNPLNGSVNCLTTPHNPNGFPIGYTFGAAAEAAGYTYTADTYNTAEDRGYTFWTVYHHPASWSDGISLGSQFGDMRLGDLVNLIPDAAKGYNDSPNDPVEDVSTCTLA